MSDTDETVGSKTKPKRRFDERTFGSRTPGSGRQALVPTDDQRHMVMVLRSNGTNIDTIARIMRLSEVTLRRHFQAELESAFAEVRARIEASMVRQALNGNVYAQNSWLRKNCADWRIDHSAASTPPPPGIAGDGETVHIYMPTNHRDEPDAEDDGPIIEGEAAEAA